MRVEKVCQCGAVQLLLGFKMLEDEGFAYACRLCYLAGSGASEPFFCEQVECGIDDSKAPLL